MYREYTCFQRFPNQLLSTEMERTDSVDMSRYSVFVLTPNSHGDISIGSLELSCISHHPNDLRSGYLIHLCYMVLYIYIYIYITVSF